MTSGTNGVPVEDRHHQLRQHARGHARQLHVSADVDIVGLCDVNTTIVGSFIEVNLTDCKPRPMMFRSTSRLYDEVAPDAVFIITPPTLHFSNCMEALDRGCHVFVEKPMVTLAQDAYALKERVDQTGRILVIGYNTPVRRSSTICAARSGPSPSAAWN